MLKTLVLRAIRGYQQTGGSVKHFAISCNFNPSCSHYTYQAIEVYGLVKGIYMGVKRIKRCNDPDCVTIIDDPVATDASRE